MFGRDWHDLKKSKGGKMPKLSPKIYQEDDFLTQKQLAERLNKSVRTIQNWRSQGLLPFKRMGNSILFHWGSCKRALGVKS